MRVSGVGEDSVLKQIVRLMEDAQMSKVRPRDTLSRGKTRGALCPSTYPLVSCVVCGVWQAPIQAMADRIAGSFALVVLCLSLLTFVLWLTLLGFNLVPESWIPLEYRNSHVVLAFTLAVATMVRPHPSHTPLRNHHNGAHSCCVVGCVSLGDRVSVCHGPRHAHCHYGGHRGGG